MALGRSELCCFPIWSLTRCLLVPRGSGSFSLPCEAGSVAGLGCPITLGPGPEKGWEPIDGQVD